MKITRLLFVAAMVALTGCDNSDGIVRPPPTDVGIFNAASNLEIIAFLREEISIGQMSYGEGAVTSFDSGPYDFHLEIGLLGQSEPLRAVSFSEDLSPDRNYTFVAIAPAGIADVLRFSIEDWPANEPDSRISIMHAFPGLGTLDVYVEFAGTDLNTAVPKGSISFAGDPLTFELTPGIYHLFLTTAGDPNDVQFESVNQGMDAGDDDVLVVSDPGDSGTISILVSRIAQLTGRLGEVGILSEVRIVQGIDDRQPRDIYLDDTTMPPYLPAHPHGVLTDYVDVTVGAHKLYVTPVNMPGTEELDQDFVGVPGRQFTALIGGDTTDGIIASFVPEDKRSIAGQATLRLLNGAGLFASLSMFIEAPGTDITDLFPIISLNSPNYSPRIPQLPGDYEITIADTLTQAVVAGPLPVTLDDGGVYGILLLNGVNSGTVDIQLFDDFIP